MEEHGTLESQIYQGQLWKQGHHTYQCYHQYCEDNHKTFVVCR